MRNESLCFVLLAVLCGSISTCTAFAAKPMDGIAVIGCGVLGTSLCKQLLASPGFASRTGVACAWIGALLVACFFVVCLFWYNMIVRLTNVIFFPTVLYTSFCATTTTTTHTHTGTHTRTHVDCCTHSYWSYQDRISARIDPGHSRLSRRTFRGGHF